MRLINRVIDSLPFELHVPGYNFCGPGTRLRKRLARGDAGVNKLDESCKAHDLQYQEHQDLESRRRADLELNLAADERLKAKDSSLGERITAAAVRTAMALKRKLGAGVKKRKTRTKQPRVLPTARFGSGQRRGGFVVPVAAAITAGLGAVKTIKDICNAQRVLAEQQRHHKVLEKIARERGV